MYIGSKQAVDDQLLLFPVEFVKEQRREENFRFLNYMKNQAKRPKQNIILTALFLSATFSWLVVIGCAMSKPTSDPLTGWKSVGNISSQVDPEGSFLGSSPCNQTIIDDVKNFIQTFPPEERGAGAGPFQLYEDGTGTHAVGFRVFIGPYTSVQYALFYDKENKRVKAIKYGKTRYMS